MLPNGEMRVPKKEILTISEVPWPEIWAKGRELAAKDNLARKNFSLPPIEQINRNSYEIDKQTGEYGKLLRQRLSSNKLSTSNRPSEKDIIHQCHEYQAKLRYADNLKLYDDQARVSLPLLAEYELFLEGLGVWQSKFTTSKEPYLAHLPERSLSDSTYYFAKDGTCIRLKKTNLLSGGLAETIQKPATRTVFARDNYTMQFTSQIVNDAKIYAPKQKLTIAPTIGLYAVDIYTEKLIKYATGQSRNKPVNGVHIATINNPDKEKDSWVVQLLHPLANIVGDEGAPYHLGHEVSLIANY